MSNFKKVISYVYPVVLKYKWAFWSIFLFYTVRILLSSVINPILYKRIIDLVSKGNLDKAFLSHSLFNTVWLICIFLPISWVFARSGQYIVSKFQSKVIKDLHDLTFSKLQNHSYTFFADNFSGSLVNKSRKFVRAFEVMHDILIDNFFSSFIAFIAIFIVFLTQSRIIAFIFFSMSILYITVIVLMSKKKVAYDFDESTADSRVTAYLADAITNILSIKFSSSAKRETEGFKKVTAEESFFRLRAWIFGNKQNAIQSAMTIIVQIIVTFVTANLWLEGKITAGLFLLVQSYSVTIGNYFWDLGRAMTKFSKAYSDMKEMTDIFEEKPGVLDAINPKPCIIKNGEIDFNNVRFEYIEGTPVFFNFNLKIKAGEKVGLVGHSGSGKSTITKILLRFMDIKEGAIMIDGQNISEITQDDLRSKIAYVPQESILFHRSIRENIAYSRPSATMDEIIAVAKEAHAHEFISKLPNGYDTMVGERGVKLSGGERQRVAIARAMIKSAPILLLDEATSSLDSISETYIQDSFNKLMEGKTTIVIAHRLSTIQKMDRIILLDNGKIAEDGTHKELLAKNGLYSKLWSHQTGGFLEE